MIEPIDDDICLRCRGAGHIEVEERVGESDFWPVDIDCPDCDGTGERKLAPKESESEQ